MPRSIVAPAIPKELIGRHTGRTIVVLGNGPSLYDSNLAHPIFTNNICITTNAVVKRIHGKYHVMCDPVAVKYFGEHAAFAQRKSGTQLIGSNHSRTVFLKKRIKPDHLVHYAINARVGPPSPGRIFHGRTVGIIALHLAYHMGAKAVLLLGIDGYGRGRRDRRDEVASQCLTLALKKFQDEGRQLYSLSLRSRYTQIPIAPKKFKG
jgi:uncharacterized Rossmann fold enzyme